MYLVTFTIDLPSEAAEDPTVPERNARLLALLDRLEAGDPEVLRRDLAALQRDLAKDRSGQRPLFGEDAGTGGHAS